MSESLSSSGTSQSRMQQSVVFEDHLVHEVIVGCGYRVLVQQTSGGEAIIVLHIVRDLRPKSSRNLRSASSAKPTSGTWESVQLKVCDCVLPLAGLCLPKGPFEVADSALPTGFLLLGSYRGL